MTTNPTPTLTTNPTANPTANLVLRELPESLWRDLRQPPDEVEAEGPLMRALLRAEAELLVADALAMEVGTYRERTPDQRRQDALDLVLHRLGSVSR